MQFYKKGPSSQVEVKNLTKARNPRTLLKMNLKVRKLEAFNFIRNNLLVTFFLIEFPKQTFTIHKTAVEGGGYSFNSSLPLPPASQTHTH